MAEGTSVNDHVLKMINLIESLGQLGFAMDGELSQDLVLQSLSDSFSQFIVNFHMNKMDVSLPELHNMLKTAESNFPSKKSSVLLIGEGSTSKKRKRTFPKKKKKIGESKPTPTKAKVDPKSNAICFHCNKVGHWKRNCKAYLAKLKKKKAGETTPSDSDMFMIEDNMSLSPISTWHCMLGHISEKRLRSLHQEELLEPFDFKSYPVCESSLIGKMTKSPFTGHGERGADVLGLVHTDVCGPMSTQAMGEFSYFITFMDDKSRFGYVYLMKHKSEAFEKFKEYRYKAEKQTKMSIKVLRSDRGGEYLSGEFPNHLKENGILSQWTPHATPQLNRFSERRNQTLLDMVQSMMSYTDLPVSLWGYAIETSAYLLNKPVRRSNRVSRQPERYYGLVIENDNDLSLIDGEDPMTFDEAMSFDDSEKWQSAIKSEMDSMYANQVWTLDLGEASYILGIKIYRARSKKMLGLTQSTYIKKVLKRYSMENSKRGLIPMSHGVSLSKKISPKTSEERERMSRIPYTSVIGSIMYAMLCTRPDVAHSLSVTSRFQSDPGKNTGKR
ncbi:uncharacterized protein LOC141695904 [Apium graveolens]|uniref:uncharacterized protein LOC141695904 n=1 Tax=Apium graveolens TaxID=4045 RepID=UPI003D7B462C